MYQYCFDNDTGKLYRVHETNDTLDCFNWKTKIWEPSNDVLANMSLLIRISEKEMLRLTDEDSIYAK